MVHQKDFMVNKLNVQTKNFDQNRQNQISMCTIFENSTASRQKEAPNSGIIKKTLTYFTNLVKKISSLKKPKNEKYGQILQFKCIIKLSETLWHRLHIHAASIKTYFYKDQVRLRKLTKTRLETVIYMHQSLKNSFQSQKVIH